MENFSIQQLVEKVDNVMDTVSRPKIACLHVFTASKVDGRAFANSISSALRKAGYKEVQLYDMSKARFSAEEESSYAQAVFNGSSITIAFNANPDLFDHISALVSFFKDARSFIPVLCFVDDKPSKQEASFFQLVSKKLPSGSTNEVHMSSKNF